jgi:hypothetical protein
MAQQTAVEWLVEQIEINHTIGYNRITIEQINQAKAMEKEQILEARLDGFKISGEGWNGEYPFEGKDDSIILEKIDNNKYYNETYKISNHDNS